jgi:NlpC/P60 family putative phage cell wall peptidase
VTETEQRGAIVAEALTWLGTPYHHFAGLKGIGADCAMFPLAVYKAAGLVPEDLAVDHYPIDWAFHRDEERYLAMVERFGCAVAPAQIGPGDFLVWRYGRTFSHGAIVVEPPRVIHAFIEAGCVTIDDIGVHGQLSTRPMRCYSFWE